MRHQFRSAASMALLLALGLMSGQPARAQPLKPAGGIEPLHGPPLADDGGLSDPVFLFNGEFHLLETDLSVAGVGMDLVVQREYRSKMGRRDQLLILFGQLDDSDGLGSIGRNWTLSLDQSIAVAGSHEIDFFAEGGRRIAFSSFAPPWGLEGGEREVAPERGLNFGPFDWCELECPDGTDPITGGPYDCQCFGEHSDGHHVVPFYPVECGTGLEMRVVYDHGVVTAVHIFYPDGSQREFIGAASLDASGTGLNAEAQSSWGRLRTIRDRNNNTIRLDYAEGFANPRAGLITSITDTVGRVFELDWLISANVPDVWSVKKVNPQSMVHLTEKPVELATRAIEYSSKPGERVLDLFGGSGSTLIAAEMTGRRAHLMEIDPAYTDVIVQRWEAFTGRKAERCQGEDVP